MPPRKHIAKSQEFVYKQVGRGSLGGSRQKYKLIATDIPRNEGSSGAPAEATPMLPPVVSAPSAVNETESLPDTSYYDNMDNPRPKRTGKVHFIYFHVDVNKNSLLLQRQSSYMRLWLDEKQAKYLKRIIEMKDGPPRSLLILGADPDRPFGGVMIALIKILSVYCVAGMPINSTCFIMWKNGMVDFTSMVSYGRLV